MAETHHIIAFKSVNLLLHAKRTPFNDIPIPNNIKAIRRAITPSPPYPAFLSMESLIRRTSAAFFIIRMLSLVMLCMFLTISAISFFLSSFIHSPSFYVLCYNFLTGFPEPSPKRKEKNHG